MLKPLIKHIIKFLKNDFPTTKIGYKLINFYCFFRRHCKPQNFIIEEKDPNSSFYIAAVLIIKNEGPYLREWLEYHKFIGFEHFFIYDNARRLTKSIFRKQKCFALFRFDKIFPIVLLYAAQSAMQEDLFA